MLAIESGVSQLDIASRVTIGLDKGKDIFDARKRIESYSLYVYDSLYRLSQIRTELQRLKSQKGLDVVILDYIQNISVTGDEVSDAREVALECQRLAKDLDCTVIACSQLSNSQARYEIVEGGDDNYYSLKGHGSIRDAADVVLTLHRDQVRQSSALKVKWRKNRHGPRSDFMCHFDLATSRIEEVAWEDEDED
jgi:replicative DNA helicase